jgi:transcriptional regulator with XRE-family HTH domain
VLNLRYSRLKLRLTQKQLGRLVGVPQPTIANFELGHRKPSDAMLGKLADALGVHPPYSLLRQVVVREEVRFVGPDEVSL